MAKRTIAHYELIEPLGRGGMGEVFRAYDTKLRRPVAIKLLPASLIADAASRKRFEREARAAASLSHPNIVTIHEFGEHRGQVYIVMELVEGQSLRQVLEQGPLAIERALDIVAQLAHALARANGRGIVHRDIKPENVVIDGDGHPKLLDFGLAKLMGASRATSPGAAVGTLRYMSPEQVAGDDVDARTDVWSLGVLLYELLAGKTPFEREHVDAVVYSIANVPHAPLSARRTGVSPELERMVDKMLAKRREDRYAHMKDVLGEVRKLVPSGSITLPPLPRHISRRRRLAAAALAVAAIAGIWWWMLGRDTSLATTRSIAVLPFTNMSVNQDDDYFSDGLSEELLDALARVEGMRVAARTSSFQFKGYTGDVSDIGDQLNVETILEGSVRRSGNRVRVSAQLINARDGFHLWSDTYEREMSDVFAIQQEIAQRVVSQLRIKLLPQSSEQLARRPTTNLDAYDAYLYGRHHIASRTIAGLNRGIEYFQRAIALDSTFALAHLGLADCYFLLYRYERITRQKAIDQMQQPIDKALALDPGLGQAYTSLAALRDLQGRSAEATRAFIKGIELAPSNTTAYHWFGDYLSREGSQDSSVVFLRKAMELDPMSSTIHGALGNTYRRSGDFDKAVPEYLKAIELNPGFPSSYLNLATIEYERGRVDSAVAWGKKAVEVDADNDSYRLTFGRRLLAAGRVEEAKAQYEAVLRRTPGSVSAFNHMAELCAYQGRLADALRWRRKALYVNPDNSNNVLLCFTACLNLGDDKAAELWMPRMAEQQSLRATIQLHRYRGEMADLERGEREYAQRFEARHHALAEIDLHAARYADVRARYAKEFPDLFNQKVPRVSSGNVAAAVNLAAALVHTEERQRGEALLAACAQYGESRPLSQRLLEGPTVLIEVYALLDQTDAALTEMRRIVDAGWRGGWWYIEVAPNLASLHGRPELVAIMQQVRSAVARERALLSEKERTP